MKLLLVVYGSLLYKARFSILFFKVNLSLGTLPMSQAVTFFALP